MLWPKNFCLEASWDDVIEEVRFWKAVDLGIERQSKEPSPLRKKCITHFSGAASNLESALAV